jgi:CRP-like cAMP-binding protein
MTILAQSELFSGANPATLQAVHAAAHRKQYTSGDAIFHQGDAATNLYAIAAGRLRATQSTADGQQVIIRYMGPGEIAGYAALTGAGTHPGTVTAVDDCDLLGWSGAVIRKIMRDDPNIALNVVSLLGHRYHDMQVRLRELSTEKVEQRIAHTILRLAERAGRHTKRGLEIAFPVSRQDLAEMSGTTLHTVSRTISAWEEQGIMDCGRRRVVVVKPEALVSISNLLR